MYPGYGYINILTVLDELTNLVYNRGKVLEI